MAIASVDQPVGDRIDRTDHGALVGETSILAKIEKADDRRHAEPVGFVQNAAQPFEIGGVGIAVPRKRRIVPGLGLAVALGTAALEIDGEAQQPGCPPDRHHLNELRRIAVGIEGTVRIGPACPRFGIAIVEDALHQTGVRQQALDLLAVIAASGKSRLAIDEEAVVLDTDDRLSLGHVQLSRPL